MQSIDVITGGTATASQYNLLRADVITNVTAAYNASAAASAAVVAASGAAADVVTHAAVVSNVHGVGASVNVLGAKQASGLRIEYARASATWTHTGGQLEKRAAGVAWGNAFANIYAVTDAVVLRSVSSLTVYTTQDWGTKYSTTGASKMLMIYNSQGEVASMEINFIGIGN